MAAPLEKGPLLVVHVSTPTIFFAHPQANVEQALEMTSKLEQVCAAAKSLTGQPLRGKIYAARFSEDNLWYRCETFFDRDQERCSKVRFVDFGNEETKNWSELVEIPQLLAGISKLALKYILYGLRPSGKKDEPSFEKGILKLKELIQDRLCMAQLLARSVNLDATPVILNNDEGVDVNMTMVATEHAIKLGQQYHNPQKSNMQLHQQQQHPVKPQHSSSDQNCVGTTWSSQQSPVRGTPGTNSGHGLIPRSSSLLAQHMSHQSKSDVTLGVTSPPRNNAHAHAQHTKGQLQSAQGHGQGQMLTLSHHQMMTPAHHMTQEINQGHPFIPQQRQPNAKKPAPRMEDYPPRPSKSGDNAYSEAIKSFRKTIDSLEAAKKELESQLKHAREQLDSQVVISKQKNVENTELRKKLNRCEYERQVLMSEKQSMGLHDRMQVLITGINKLKQLRVQFPTDHGHVDGIQNTITMVTDKELRIDTDLQVTASVIEKVDVYNALQELITATTDEASLGDLIDSRNAARKDLYAAINDFTEVVSQLPLDERAKQLNEQIETLNASHSTYIKIKPSSSSLSVDDAVDAYSAWIIKKRSEFQEVRTSTNTAHNCVISMLARLRQRLSLDVGGCNDESLLTRNLDEQIASLLKHVKQEIHVTDMGAKDDCKFISKVLSTLMNELKTELEEIEKLRALDTDYRNIMYGIKDWLDSSVDLTDIKGVRATIKGLKSKLRHMMADLSDLEEGDGHDSGALADLKYQLSDTRRSLQSAFVAEDIFMERLTTQIREHFPEMVVKFPELQLGEELQYGGLVKTGRDLNQFDTKMMAGTSTSILISEFNDHAVILKEFLVGKQVGVPKEEFLGRLQEFNAVSNENLTRIEIVFFQQGDQHAFLQLPRYQQNLHDYVFANTRLSDEEIYDIIKGVTSALRSLHDANIVHGAVHPNNIFLTAQKQAVLSEYDMTKSLSQRVEKPFMVNGLKFSSISRNGAKFSSNYSKADDMCCVGLLALWMYQPTNVFITARNGVPVYSLTDMPAFMQQLINNLLSVDAPKRYTAADVLELSYFKKSPFMTSPAANLEETTLKLQRKSPSPPAPADPQVRHGILKTPVVVAASDDLDLLQEIASADTLLPADTQVADTQTANATQAADTQTADDTQAADAHSDISSLADEEPQQPEEKQDGGTQVTTVTPEASDNDL